MDLLGAAAKSLEVDATDLATLCLNIKVSDFILKEMNEQAKKDGLYGFEMAKKIKLWP